MTRLNRFQLKSLSRVLSVVSLLVFVRKFGNSTLIVSELFVIICFYFYYMRGIILRH